VKNEEFATAFNGQWLMVNGFQVDKKRLM